MKNIKLDQLVETFSQMEDSEALFKIKDGNHFFWDIVRIDIFVFIYNKIEEKDDVRSWPAHKKVSTFIKVLKNLKNQGINFLIRLCLHKKNSNFIFFKTLRINDTNNLYDPILEAPYDALKNTKTSFNLSSDPNFFNFLAPLFSSSFPLSMPRVIYSIKNPKIDELTQKISIAVNKYFGINIDQDYEEIILDSVIKYLSDLNFWEKVFRDYKPSSIFLCDNGAFKGLYRSAGKFKIKVYEFQHGEIGDRNIRYFYPASIEPNVHCNLPHSLLTFSDYWSNQFLVSA